MMKKLIILTMIAAFVFTMSLCSNDRNPLNSVSHPEGWANETSGNFHGTKILTIGYVPCKSCHGSELKGGKAEVSCFACHQIYPHAEAWTKIGVNDNHGAYIKDQGNSTYDCTGCHGEDLKGGRCGVSCYDCHAEGGLP